MTTINSSLMNPVDAKPTPSLKACPFCASLAEIVGATGQGVGVRCTGCGVSFPAIYKNLDQPIALWSQRRGTVSSAGGRATRGKCSRRKLRAARRNLKKGRQQKQLKRIRANIEAMMPQFRAARAAEMAEAKDRAVQSLARVQFLMKRHGLSQ
jgi:transcription elongation factor Elf1